MEVAYPARAESSPELRHAIRGFLESLRLDRSRVDDLVLAVGEAAANAIEHAYAGGEGDVRLRAECARGTLVIEVFDAGRWRLGGDPERGRGLGIMRALVDHVSIESTHCGTCVRLESRL